MARGDGLSGTATNDQVEDDFEFDCPECGTHIRGEVDHCPKCGVEFVIEEVADIECPHCHATVSGESVTCPECGTPHHQDCWEYYGGCGVYGCPQGPQKGGAR